MLISSSSRSFGAVAIGVATLPAPGILAHGGQAVLGVAAVECLELKGRKRILGVEHRLHTRQRAQAGRLVRHRGGVRLREDLQDLLAARLQGRRDAVQASIQTPD